MKRKIQMIVALSLLTTGVMAQKINPQLTQLVEQSEMHRAQGLSALDTAEIKNNINVTFRADGTLDRISVIATLKQGAALPAEQLERMGIKVRLVVSDMVVLDVPADQLMQLEQVEEFSYVDADEMQEMDNNLAREETKVDKVNTLSNAQTEGLPQAYTGAGVLVGVVDRGIDFNHASFRTEDGATRVKKAIVFDREDKTEYTTEDEIKALTTDDTTTSHGSHTSATAGGSNMDTNAQGMAPEADLMLVGIGRSSYTASIAQGIKDIFAYADQVNKPAVVNISFGSITGLHDGSELIAKTVAELTENGTKPGRAVMVSSGNSANSPVSISKKLQADEELKTVLGASTAPTKRYPNRNIGYRLNIYSYAEDYQDFNMQLKVVNVTNGEIEDVGTHVLNRNNEVYVPQLKKQNPSTAKGVTAVVYTLYCNNIHMDDPNLRLMLVAKAGTDGQTLRLIRGGKRNIEPELDAPTDKGYNFAENGYTKGSGEFAFNRGICNDAVISVGSYITRNQWNDYLGESHSLPESRLTGQQKQIDEISDYSSYAIADDNGKPHPTLIAPGQRIVSAANNYDTDFFEKDKPGTLKSRPESVPIIYQNKFERDNWYIAFQGTSMSTPVVTGIVALWMQADPTLNVNRIKEIMKETCDNDSWTTDPVFIPSKHKEQAGYGKVNCLKGLKKILGTTAVETISIDGRREATPATMYSVDAPVYNVMGQRVDKSKRGLVIYKGRKYVNR